MAQQVSDVRYPGYLRDLVVDYKIDKLIAPMVLPQLGVANLTGVYYEFSRAEALSVPETLSTDEGYAKEDVLTSSQTAFALEKHHRRHFLAQTLIDNQDDVVGLEERISRRLWQRLMLRYEQDVASMVFKAANYSASNKIALAGNDQWSSDLSDPFEQIETARAACIREPNTIIIGGDVWPYVKKHSKFIDRVKGGATTMLPAKFYEMVASEMFEVENVFVGKQRYNSTPKKATATYSYLWSDMVVLAYINPESTIDDVTFGNTLIYTPSASSSRMAEVQGVEGGARIRKYEEPAKGEGFWLEVEQYRKPTIVSADCGYCIYDVLA